MRRGLVLALVAGSLIGVLVVAEVLGGSSSRAARAAPALPTTVLQQPGMTLTALRGKPAVVHFWASWCGPCTKEAPHIAALSGALGTRAALVGVDWSDNGADARQFLRRHHWTFPVLEDKGGTVGERYGIAGLPTTFIVDARGRITKKITGPITEQQILDALPKSS